MMKLLSMSAVFLLAIARTDHPDAASLGGHITDETMVAIPSATISARNVFSDVVESARSDSTGSFEFTGLRQGRYSVFANAEGYGCTWVFNVVLYRGKRTQLDLILRASRKGVPSEECNDSVRISR
jgi:carboxypeptidase family protein